MEKRFGIERVGVRAKQQVGLDLGESVCSFALFSLDIFFFFFLSFHCKRIVWYPNTPHLHLFFPSTNKHVPFRSHGGFRFSILRDFFFEFRTFYALAALLCRRIFFRQTILAAIPLAHAPSSD